MGFELDRVHGGAVTSASEQRRSETILGEDGARGGHADQRPYREELSSQLNPQSATDTLSFLPASWSLRRCPKGAGGGF